MTYLTKNGSGDTADGVVINRDTLTIKQLAEEIDLREATVWAFRKKTLERINKKGMNRGEVLKSLVSE